VSVAFTAVTTIILYLSYSISMYRLLSPIHDGGGRRNLRSSDVYAFAVLRTQSRISDNSFMAAGPTVSLHYFVKYSQILKLIKPTSFMRL